MESCGFPVGIRVRGHGVCLGYCLGSWIIGRRLGGSIYARDLFKCMGECYVE